VVGWSKVDIVHYLSKARGYRSYLEICTPTTGNQFSEINQSQFDVCHRLMYRCPDDFADGHKIDFRSPSLDLSSCAADIRRGNFGYDIILVDPWHEYETSLRDMQLALSLLSDGGSIVIHDCNPPTADIISPQFMPGSWCGVTFIAYLDFVAQNSRLTYRTVDADYGCGVVHKLHVPSDVDCVFPLRDLWNSTKSDPVLAFEFAQKNKHSLLHLISVDDFIRAQAEAIRIEVGLRSVRANRRSGLAAGVAGEGLSLHPGLESKRSEVRLLASDRAPSACSDRILFSHRIERSILDAPNSCQAFPPFVVAGRERQATCSDVAWIGKNHLATVNLYGQHLRIYALVEEDGRPLGLNLVRELNGLASPEGVAASPDGSMLAISHSLSNEFGITLHRIIEGASLELSPAELLCAGRSGCAFHGVNFSPDGRYLAYTIVGNAPTIEIVQLSNNSITTRIEAFNPFMSPKSIAFSADGQFVVIAYGLIATPVDSQLTDGGRITVHRFNSETGKIEVNPVAEYGGEELAPGFVDMSTFLPAKIGETYHILIADQGADRIPIFAFDADAATLVPAGVFAENLSFPHGIEACPDGGLVAVTTYGDDAIHIARGESVSSTEIPLIPRSRPASAAMINKRRIAIVGHLAGEYLGGAERSLIDVIAAIDRERYIVTVFLPTNNDKYAQSVKKYVDDIVVFPYQWRSIVPCDPKAVARFELEFQRNQIDLVHVNTITLVAPLMAALRLKIPTIVHARELVDRDDELAKNLGGEASKIVATIKALSDFIVANSDLTHRLFEKRGNSVRLYNCVDLDYFDLVNHIDPGKLKVGIISNNSPHKGIEEFVGLAIAAADRQSELEFLVIGPPTDHSGALERTVRSEFPSTNIRFFGYVPSSAEAIQLVNVIASFSTIPESFGRTISEGMAARRPIISYNKGAAPELIRHDRDGFLIADGNAMSALEHLEALSACPSRVLEMGRNGRNRAEQLFSPHKFAVALNEIYRRLLEGQNSGAKTPVHVL